MKIEQCIYLLYFLTRKINLIPYYFNHRPPQLQIHPYFWAIVVRFIYLYCNFSRVTLFTIPSTTHGLGNLDYPLGTTQFILLAGILEDHFAFYYNFFVQYHRGRGLRLSQRYYHNILQGYRKIF